MTDQNMTDEEERAWNELERKQNKKWDTSDMAYRPNGLSVEQAEKQDVPEPLMKIIREKFTSGNSVAVERITLKRSECEAALAKPEQEPVVEVQFYGEKQVFVLLKPLNDGDKLYTAPVKREWVGLTREEIVSAYCSIQAKEWAIGGMDDVLPFTRAIEAKLKERNT